MLKHPADVRQLGIVTVYLGLVLGMYFVPQMRHVLVFVVACGFAFLTMLVAHNHLHQGIFRSQRLNNAFRLVLSFCALYPISTNVPAHNLVHHRFEDDGQLDWADPTWVDFKWNLLNLLHFPNAIGTIGLAGTKRYLDSRAGRAMRRQYLYEQIFSLGVSGLLVLWDPFAGLFFLVLPQLFGARAILRLNLLQHDGCDLRSRYNHSRNFVGRFANWLMCNNGLHTIHHNRAGLHWSELPRNHARDIEPNMDPALNEPSLLWYLVRTYVFRVGRAASAALGERTRLPGLPDPDARLREEPSRAESEALAAEAAE